jgi:hypothetical protein
VASTLRLPAIFLGGKLVEPLIAAPNGECTNEMTQDRAKKA